VLDQLAAEGSNPSAPLTPSVTQQNEPIDKGNAEHLLANLDQLSDESVDSLLTDMLADEKVSE
jgi:hypothetical protein